MGVELNVSSYVINTGPNKENEENYVRKRLTNCILPKLLSVWMDHVAFMRRKRNTYKILVRKIEENNYLGTDHLIILKLT